MSFDRALQAATRAYLRTKRYAFVSKAPWKLHGKWVWPVHGRSHVLYASCFRGPDKADRREVRDWLRWFPVVKADVVGAA